MPAQGLGDGYLKVGVLLVAFSGHTDKYHCYLHNVHYRNQTVFHELLPLLPYVECTTATFEADIAKLRATHSPFHWALLFPGIALMALAIIGWLGLLELNNKNRGSL
ncbi:MAG: hypothetical protein WCS28_06445 [Thiomicrospira sp.]